jgi:site-specific DNA-methyltransferase (adenine-specific)
VRQETAEALLARHPGSAKLVYLDPPFGTGKRFFLLASDALGESIVAYVDPVETERVFHRRARSLLRAVRRALRPDGVVVLQADSNRSAHYRLHLERAFGGANFWGEWIVRAGVSRQGLREQHSAGVTPAHHSLIVFGVRPLPFRSAGRRADGPWSHPATPELWNTLWLDIDTRGYESGYPTEKSVALMQRLVDWLTVQGDLVLEPFGGSGNLSITALGCGRRAALADVSEVAVRVAWHRVLRASIAAQTTAAFCGGAGIATPHPSIDRTRCAESLRRLAQDGLAYDAALIDRDRRVRGIVDPATAADEAFADLSYQQIDLFCPNSQICVSQID